MKGCGGFVMGIVLLANGTEDFVIGICLIIAGGCIMIGLWFYGLLGCP